ncbi:urease accessory protein UreF [Lichenihabitans sp. PAMC28606]|uniref:urease accessory protein UreF n=1 Tax=Lichenihabitans sp. PAMC28606 TaxID=2880932 RepID=UPI001D09C354|nr:urease accessory UreF family protein [Lichenihabitans sp. PAMC28606]UDL93850.1 urease accessory protein UreF [Lichenihabitans sp. PAMC28606]
MTETGVPLRLAIWMSPMFPVGGFAYSHGLEWAAESGDLPNAEALLAWLGTVLSQGAPYNDAIILAEAYRAARDRDRPRLAAVSELGLALATSRERRLETATQGHAFLSQIGKSWPCDTLALIDRRSEPDIAYPVAVGLVAAGHDQHLGATIDMFLLGVLSNLVSAAIRLSIVGQTDAQKVMAALLTSLHDVAQRCETAGLDGLGGSAFRSDLAAIRHETQYSRLFRS